MRLPSYFAGDLRKLKRVSREELRRRCSERFMFFDGVIVGLVLSTKGDTSEAEMMSGGDFDGDRAFVTWEKDIVSHVQFFPAPDSRREQFQVPESPHSKQLVQWSEPSWSKAIVDFTWHHREDSICLGKLW